MKLIIDIDESTYDKVCKMVAHINPEYIDYLLEVISNGTPIPDNATVCDIEQIRDEIKAEMDDIASGCVAKYSHDEGYYSGLRWALKIIDKYTKD